MKYSVWNDNARRYDYYQTSETGPTHAPPPSHLRPKSELGATPEEAAYRLPSHAAPAGSGDLAQGRIASLGDDAPSTSSTSPLVWLGLGALGVATLLHMKRSR